MKRFLCILLLTALLLSGCKRGGDKAPSSPPSADGGQIESQDVQQEASVPDAPQTPQEGSFDGLCGGEEAGKYVILADDGARITVGKELASDLPKPILKSGHRVRVVYRGERGTNIEQPQALYFLRDTAEDERELMLWQSDFGCSKERFNGETERGDYLAATALTKVKQDKNENRYLKAQIIADSAGLDAFFRPRDDVMRYYRSYYQEYVQKYGAQYNAAFFADKALVGFGLQWMTSYKDVSVIGGYADGKTYHIVLGESNLMIHPPFEKSGNVMVLAEIPRSVLQTCNQFVVDLRFADRTRIVGKTDTEILVDSRIYPIWRNSGIACHEEITAFPVEDISKWQVGDEVIVAHTGKFTKEEPWRGELIDIQKVS